MSYRPITNAFKRTMLDFFVDANAAALLPLPFSLTHVSGSSPRRAPRKGGVADLEPLATPRIDVPLPSCTLAASLEDEQPTSSQVGASKEGRGGCSQGERDMKDGKRT